MPKKSGKKGFLALKVDLEKAYGRVRWDFLEDSLIEVGIPSILISVIMHCVSSANMQVLWNGSLTNKFKPSRCLRQGNPLSPYLFAIFMERLAHGINAASARKEWKPIFLSKNGPPLTCLFFDDDLILFAEASELQVNTINRVLDTFCMSLGQRVNKDKTIVLFSKNVDVATRKRLSLTLGMEAVDDLGKYLGVPLLNSRVTKHTFQYIIDRMKRKLATWEVVNLSLAGRITLAQFVLATIPSYIMQSVLLPKSVCEEIDKLSGNLFGMERRTETK